LKNEIYNNPELYRAVATSIKERDPDLTNNELKKAIDIRVKKLIRNLKDCFLRYKNRILKNAGGDVSNIADESRMDDMTEVLPSATNQQLTFHGGEINTGEHQFQVPTRFFLPDSDAPIVAASDDCLSPNINITSDIGFHDADHYEELKNQRLGDEISRDINCPVQDVSSSTTSGRGRSGSGSTRNPLTTTLLGTKNLLGTDLNEAYQTENDWGNQQNSTRTTTLTVLPARIVVETSTSKISDSEQQNIDNYELLTSWPASLSSIEYIICSIDESHDCKKNLDSILDLFNSKSLKDGDEFPPATLMNNTSWHWNNYLYNGLLEELFSINLKNSALESSSHTAFDQNTLMINGVIRYEESIVSWDKAKAFNILPSVYIVPNPNVPRYDMVELLSHATIFWGEGDNSRNDHHSSHFFQDNKYPFLIRRSITTNPVLPGSVITLSRRRRSDRKFTTLLSKNDDDVQQDSDLYDNDDTSSAAPTKGKHNRSDSDNDERKLKRCFEKIYKAHQYNIVGLEEPEVSPRLSPKVRKVLALNAGENLRDKYLRDRFLEIAMPSQCDFTFSKDEVNELQFIDRLSTVKGRQKVNGSLIPLLQFCLSQAKHDSSEEQLSLARIASKIFDLKKKVSADQTAVLQKLFEYRSGLKELLTITFTKLFCEYALYLQYTTTDLMFKEFTVFTAASPPQIHVIPSNVVCEKEFAGVLMAFMEVSGYIYIYHI